jgi:hypothetical protein
MYTLKKLLPQQPQHSEKSGYLRGACESLLFVLVVLVGLMVIPALALAAMNWNRVKILTGQQALTSGGMLSVTPMLKSAIATTRDWSHRLMTRRASYLSLRTSAPATQRRQYQRQHPKCTRRHLHLLFEPAAEGMSRLCPSKLPKTDTSLDAVAI